MTSGAKAGLSRPAESASAPRPASVDNSSSSTLNRTEEMVSRAVLGVGAGRRVADGDRLVGEVTQLLSPTPTDAVPPETLITRVVSVTVSGNAPLARDEVRRSSRRGDRPST